MFSTTDTIVAIATPPGRGGIGVVRLSGPDAHRIGCGLTDRGRPLEPRRATFATIRLKRETSDEAWSVAAKSKGTARPENNRVDVSAIDHVVATYFPGPASYTGDDVVELSAHGSPVVLRAIVMGAMHEGARLAEPGEFTLRAFLNGRIDLIQAEAVADLIEAVTPLQARAAFDQLQGTLTGRIREIDGELFDLIARLEASIDFPEEGYHFVAPAEVGRVVESLLERIASMLAAAGRGRLIREGVQVAIVGKPNVGKSSVFNALVGAERAIVAAAPGTTRDLLTEVIDVDGQRVTLVDTAGLRETNDVVESEGVERARKAQSTADVILVILDGSRPLDECDHRILADTTGSRRVVVANKADLDAAWTEPGLLRVSATVPIGLDDLCSALAKALDVDPSSDQPEITNARHGDLLRRARESIARVHGALALDGDGLSEEFVLVDLQEARALLDEVVGRRTPDDVLTHIFSRFCIGK